MPWQTPTLEELRALNRDNVQAQLRSGPMVPNSVLRVMSDANSGLAYLTLLYINWLALQLMPDTAETEWLDRFGSIWLTQGRKVATFASVSVSFTGIGGVTMPAGTILNAGSVLGGGSLQFATQTAVVIGSSATAVAAVALSPGETGLAVGGSLSLQIGIAGINGSGTITAITDGVNQETDDELRVRVLDRIREPPMGGDAEDYVQWALEVPGVTRAWCAPNEMGVGTVTVRFMMDDVRVTNDPMTNGFPTSGDVANVLAYLVTKRPVAIKDFFVQAPIAEPINFTISGLNVGASEPDILANVTAMLRQKAAPSHAINGVTQPPQEIYAAWVSDAILNSDGVDHFDLLMSDRPMPYNGSMAVMGTITYS
jgi:uncharacterized phage protein gp47/JayE